VNVLDSVRKGFKFFLMSMGVSTYEKKPKAVEAATVAPVIPTKPE